VRGLPVETSVTAGTIFAGTRMPLVSWFAAIWYVVNQKQGVSALGLQRVLGLGSYQTAWAWLHKLRRAMVLHGRELLSGAVEVDETYVGARHTSVGGRSPGHKAIVAIAVEGDQEPERVRMRRIPNVKRDTLSEFVLDHVLIINNVNPLLRVTADQLHLLEAIREGREQAGAPVFERSTIPRRIRRVGKTTSGQSSISGPPPSRGRRA
jgi:ISXO2-like transposase domain